MTQREFNALRWHDRHMATHSAAARVNAALNLFGPGEPPISHVMDATTDEDIDRLCDALLTPDGDAFPRTFVEQARPAVNAYRRVAKQSLRATPAKIG